MSPAKTPKKLGADKNDNENIPTDKKMLQLKTGGIVTPKRSAAPIVAGDENESSSTPSKKVAKGLKTPKRTTLEQTPTSHTPKGNLGDPSPLQTRSARKKKAALAQENSALKSASPVKNETPSVRSVGNRNLKKPAQGSRKVSQEPSSEDEGKDALDSDDLDSDDMDEDEAVKEQKVQSAKPAKSKNAGKNNADTEKKKHSTQEEKIAKKNKEKIIKVKEEIDPDLEEAAQTPLPTSPEAPAFVPKLEEVKSPKAVSKPTQPELKSPKGVKNVTSKKPEITSPKATVGIETGNMNNMQPTEALPVVAEDKVEAPTAVEGDCVKSPTKRSKKQKDATKKARKDEPETEKKAVKVGKEAASDKAPAEEESVQVTEETASTPAAEPASDELPAQPVANPTEIPSKSPGKRTKGSKEGTKRAKLIETNESPVEEKSGEKSSEHSETSTSSPKKTKKGKPAQDEMRIDSIVNLKVMAKGQTNEEEKIVQLRMKMTEAGSSSEEIEHAVRRFRRVLLKRKNLIRCKRCLQRGHDRKQCPHPPRAHKCYKCGSSEHLAAKCSIKENIFTFAECDICRQTGHLTKSCPEKRPKAPKPPAKQTPNPKPQSGKKCFKCGETDHNMFSCSIKEDSYPFAKCRVCRKAGHLFKDCPILNRRRIRAIAEAKGTKDSETGQSEVSDATDTKGDTNFTFPSKKSKKSGKSNSESTTEELKDQTGANEAVKKSEKAKRNGENVHGKKSKESTDVPAQTETVERATKKKIKKEQGGDVEEQSQSEQRGKKKNDKENTSDQPETKQVGKKKKNVKKEGTEEVKENVEALTEAQEPKKKKKSKQLLSASNASEIDAKESKVKEEPVAEKKKKKTLKNLKVES